MGRLLLLRKRRQGGLVLRIRDLQHGTVAALELVQALEGRRCPGAQLLGHRPPPERPAGRRGRPWSGTPFPRPGRQRG